MTTLTCHHMTTIVISHDCCMITTRSHVYHMTTTRSHVLTWVTDFLVVIEQEVGTVGQQLGGGVAEGSVVEGNHHLHTPRGERKKNAMIPPLHHTVTTTTVVMMIDYLIVRTGFQSCSHWDWYIHAHSPLWLITTEVRYVATVPRKVNVAIMYGVY